jgi:hypothetical protein
MKIRADHPQRRRGSIYVVVLGFSMLAAILAIGSVLASRVQLRAASTASDMAQARINAQSAIELAKDYIYSDSTWRTDQPNGVWTLPASAGGGTFSVSVIDPIDGNLTNRPHDPIAMTATAYYGNARQILTETLTANPTPMPILQYAISTATDFKLSGSGRLILGTGTLSVSGQYQSDPATFLEGNLNCTKSTGNNKGTLYGTMTVASATPTFPSSSIVQSYINLGTVITLSGVGPAASTISNQVFGPGYNSYGTANADGVYVIQSNTDVTLHNVRVYGTLVVNNAGHKTILDNTVLLQTYRSDYPALICAGDCTMQFTSPNTTMSEATNGVNYNPVGAPYNGLTDTDMTDTYPSEIDGLVHICGMLTVSQPCLIRGAVIVGSTSSNAFQVTASQMQVIYNPALYTSPPQYYTTQVKMVPQTGTWLPVVN